MRQIKYTVLAGVIGLISIGTAAAKPDALTTQQFGHVTAIHESCVQNWGDQSCMQSISATSKDMLEAYAVALEKSGHKAQVETVKNQCAATTAAAKTKVPAYAMKSALTECANTISDVVAEVTVQPDLVLYQLLVGSIFCLGKEEPCPVFEKGISAAVAQ